MFPLTNPIQANLDLRILILTLQNWQIMKSSVFDFDSIQYEGTAIFGLTDLRNRLDFGPNLKYQSKNRLFCPRANSMKIKSCIRNNIKINLCEILDLASSLTHQLGLIL